MNQPDEIPNGDGFDEFDWRIYADGTAAGLTVLIPIPLVDLAFDQFVRPQANIKFLLTVIEDRALRGFFAGENQACFLAAAELAAKVKDAFYSFDWTGTALEKEFKANEFNKFIAITYQDNWSVIRKIQKFNEILPPDLKR